MVKVDLLRSITRKLDGCSQKDVMAVLDAYAEVVLETLTNDKTEKVPLLGIGSFTVKHVPERSGVATLADGKEWTVPEHDEVKFTISKSVKTLA